MTDAITINLDPKTLKGAALGIAFILIALLLIVSFLKPFLFQGHAGGGYYNNRQFRGNGLWGFIVLLTMFGGLKYFFNTTNLLSPSSTEQVEHKTEPVEDGAFNYRNGSDSAFNFNETSAESSKNTTLTKVSNVVPSEQPTTRRFNVAPSNQTAKDAPIAQRVALIDNKEDSYPKIYYVQLGVATNLDDALEKIKILERRYPNQVFLAKDPDATTFAMKLLYGGFSSKSQAKKAVGDNAAYVRNELQDNLIFIDYN